jgi:diguanylate cyclase (GGDEF)-like protein/PAS domain S-box-containing protein
MPATAMERLLDRQIERARVTSGELDLATLRATIAATYAEAERDRLRTERAMRLMAEELQDANRRLEELVREISVQSLRFRAAIDNMPHGLAMYDAQERLVVVSARFCATVGMPERSIAAGMTLRQALEAGKAHGRFPGQDIEELYERRRMEVRRAGTTETEEHQPDRSLLVTSRPMEGGGCVLVVQDITERRAAESRIAHLARHDTLTDLPNRAELMAQVEQALARAQRGAGFALLCLDLDRFKQVNDTLGHPVGDKLLREVTARLRQSVRAADVVARLGGDEFAIIQDAASQPESATALSERLVSVIGAPYVIDGHGISVGVSIGIALAPADGASAEALMKNADLALYRAKGDGRGTWRCFEPAMDQRIQHRRRLEMDLRAALDRGEFAMVYQPLVDVTTGRLNAFEALLRWNHPTRGVVPPDEFIPLAEETGLILPIGRWVLGRACREAAAWPMPHAVAVNVSPAQFRQPGFVDDVVAALGASGLPPERLELEVTETIMLQDSVATVAQLNRLRRLGVRIAMDDFGTGYSSLSYLRSFPFDKIKIDRSFIRDLGEREEARAIVRAIAALGTSLGMRTAAEGVETQEQLSQLSAEGCTDAQGFLFGRPMPPQQVIDMLGAGSDAA